MFPLLDVHLVENHIFVSVCTIFAWLFWFEIQIFRAECLRTWNPFQRHFQQNHIEYNIPVVKNWVDLFVVSSKLLLRKVISYIPFHVTLFQNLRAQFRKLFHINNNFPFGNEKNLKQIFPDFKFKIHLIRKSVKTRESSCSKHNRFVM